MEYATIAFLSFFAVSAAAIYFAPDAHVREGYSSVLIGVVIFAGMGLVLQPTWPFFSWSLYGVVADSERTFYEARVVDGDGTELKYDARAASPAVPTPINRHAGSIATELSTEKQRALGCHLLREAVRYRDRAPKLRATRFVVFPPHQFGYRWTRDHFEGFGTVEHLRVYQVTIVYDEHGRSISNQSSQMEWQIHRDTCS